MALDIDGSDDKINCGDIATDGLTIMCISAWVNITTLEDFAWILGKWEADASDFSMAMSGSGLNDNNDVIVTCRNGATNQHARTNADLITTDVWNHWFMVFNGGGALSADRLRFYFNGVNQTLTFGNTPPTSTATNAANFYIGAKSNDTSFVDAYIAEVAIWAGGYPGGGTGAIDESQGAASSLAKSYSPRFLRKNGIHYWPLIGANSPVRDLWGGNAGTVTGAVASPHPRVIYPRTRKVVPAASAAVAGRIFKLAGLGGGLAGPSRGLVAKPRKKRIPFIPPKIEVPAHVAR
jgi:hypothetical protein